MENHHFLWENSLSVSLPEGKIQIPQIVEFPNGGRGQTIERFSEAFSRNGVAVVPCFQTHPGGLALHTDNVEISLEV